MGQKIIKNASAQSLYLKANLDFIFDFIDYKIQLTNRGSQIILSIPDKLNSYIIKAADKAFKKSDSRKRFVDLYFLLRILIQASHYPKYGTEIPIDVIKSIVGTDYTKYLDKLEESHLVQHFRAVSNKPKKYKLDNSLSFTFNDSTKLVKRVYKCKYKKDEFFRDLYFTNIYDDNYCFYPSPVLIMLYRLNNFEFESKCDFVFPKKSIKHIHTIGEKFNDFDLYGGDILFSDVTPKYYNASVFNKPTFEDLVCTTFNQRYNKNAIPNYLLYSDKERQNALEFLWEDCGMRGERCDSVESEAVKIMKNDKTSYAEIYKLLDYKRNYHVPAKLASDGRYYHWFHSLDKTERKNVLLLGDTIKEVFDVTACFYTLLAKLMECHLDLDCEECKDELAKFQKLVVEKDIYKEIADYSGVFNRDDIKLALQAWRNLLPRYLNSQIANNTDIRMVHDYMTQNFPAISDIIINYPTYVNSDGKVVKRLQRDCTLIETEVISNGLCRMLINDYDMLPITLHDAIYMRECDINKCKENNIDLRQLYFYKLDLSLYTF